MNNIGRARLLGTNNKYYWFDFRVSPDGVYVKDNKTQQWFHAKLLAPDNRALLIKSVFRTDEIKYAKALVTQPPRGAA